MVSGDEPMARANVALPWIVFERYRTLFERRFPQLRVCCIKQFMPLAFLPTGGISSRFGMPKKCYQRVRRVERWVESRGVGMSALIVVEKC